MAKLIKGKTQSLQWLGDLLAFFQTETIKIPSTYRERVLKTKNLLTHDTSGIVNTMLNFAMESALVEYSIETDNDNLTKMLNDWLIEVNASLRGKIPTGLRALAKEYFRERWKGSSQLLLRSFWEKKDDLILPTTMFFLDGEDIKCKNPRKDGMVELGGEKYYIRVDQFEKNDILLPRKDKNEEIFIQKPYEGWGTLEPMPFLIRKGLYRNLMFFELMSSKGEYIFGKALEYLLMIKKGTERMALEGRAEMVYSEDDLKNVSKDLQSLLDRKKNEAGTPTYTTGFDTDMSHLIPDYKLAMNEAIYQPLERRMLAGLGLVDIVEGTASTRREAMLNPKPFIAEIKHGVQDFSMLLNDVIRVIIEKNSSKHRKWMGAKIEVNTTPVREFIDDKLRQMFRSLYDRGALSKRTLVEVAGELDYDIEVRRRKQEKKDGDEETMYPPVVQAQEQMDEETPQKKEETLQDRQGPEKKNFDQSSVYEEAPYKKNSELPASVKVLPAGGQSLWRRVFNENYGKGEDYARKVAWTAVKNVYKKVGDKWVKKSKGEIEESLKNSYTLEELSELKRLQLLGKQDKLLSKLLNEMEEAEKDENTD